MTKRDYGPEYRDYMDLVEHTMEGKRMSLRDALALSGNCIMQHEAEDMLSLRRCQNCHRWGESTSSWCSHCGLQW